MYQGPRSFLVSTEKPPEKKQQQADVEPGRYGRIVEDDVKMGWETELDLQGTRCFQSIYGTGWVIGDLSGGGGDTQGSRHVGNGGVVSSKVRSESGEHLTFPRRSVSSGGSNTKGARLVCLKEWC